MSRIISLLKILLDSLLQRLIERVLERLLHWEKVISPRVSYRKQFNLWVSPVTTFTADHEIEKPSAIVGNADKNRIIHGQLMMVFVPYPFALVCELTTLGVKPSVIVHDMVLLLFNYTICTLTRV